MRSGLASADVRPVLDLAADLAACETPSELSGRLATLPALVGADSVLAARLVRAAPGTAHMTASVADDAVYSAAAVEAATRTWREHPVLARHAARRSRRPIAISDFVSDREWRSDVVFNEVYRPAGLAYELAVQTDWSPSACGCVALHRSRMDFGDRERAVLEVLGPHLEAADRRVRVRTGLPGPEALRRALPLTGRESEVLALIVAGAGNREIADRLGVRPRTVAHHLEHVYAKLQVTSRSAAAAAALGALV